MYSIDYTPRNNNTSTFIETPDVIKNKKCIINPQYKDNKCVQYSVTLSLHHQEIKCHLERI